MTTPTYASGQGRYDVLAWDREGRLMLALNGLWAPQAKVAYEVLTKRDDVGKARKVKVR